MDPKNLGRNNHTWTSISQNVYTACAILSNLVSLVEELEPSAGPYGPRFIKIKINSLIVPIDAVLLYCFPEKGKMVLSGKWYEITWYDSQLRGLEVTPQ